MKPLESFNQDDGLICMSVKITLLMWSMIVEQEWKQEAKLYVYHGVLAKHFWVHVTEYYITQQRHYLSAEAEKYH